MKYTSEKIMRALNNWQNTQGDEVKKSKMREEMMAK